MQQMQAMDSGERWKDRARQDIVTDFINQTHRLSPDACKAAQPVVYDGDTPAYGFSGVNGGMWLLRSWLHARSGEGPVPPEGG